ncbi:MAG: hypothetical protein HPY71_07770 [Firmicutes bacterium]|nr:hypothetical protein [Bacillota bacterium]
MLDRNVTMFDIDYKQWRRLYDLIWGPYRGRPRVYVLHDGGRVRKVYHSVLGILPTSGVSVSDPESCGRELAEEYNADETVIIERSKLQQLYASWEKSFKVDEDFDDYLVWFFNMIGQAQDDGAVYIYTRESKEAKPRGITYNGLKNVLVRVPDGRTAVLAIFSGREIWASLIVGKAGGRVSLVTTTDSLVADGLVITEWKKSYKDILRLVRAKFGWPYLGIFTTREEFERIWWAKDQAAAARQAFFRGNLILDPLPLEVNFMAALPSSFFFI